MGRIKTTLIKRTGKKLVKLYGDKFSKDFESNKQAMADVADIPSKKMKNIVAGYVARLMRKQEQE